MRRGAPLRSVFAAMVASTPAPPTALVDLRGPSDLRAAFNNDRGRLRIILLLSPT